MLNHEAVEIGEVSLFLYKFCFQENEKMKVGRSTVLDYNNAKTKMEKSESDMIQAKYEVIFNCKILDFYAQERFAYN